MEDYSRDLEKELSKYSVPNPFKQSRRWQLLFVSDDGKTIAVKKYKGLVISVLAALVTAVLFSICMTVLYYKSSVEKKSLRVAIEKADKELRKATEERELLNARLFFEKKEKSLAVDTEDGIDKEEKEKPKSVEKKVEPVEEKVSVGVEAFAVTRETESKLTRIKFHIRNTSKVKRISGYVFVILKPESGKQQDWLTLPPVLLKDGEPSVYKRGRYFSINHFKSMNFKFKDNFDVDYKNATVYVYSKAADSSGESLKVFEQTYPVNIQVVEKKNASGDSEIKESKKGEKIAQHSAEPQKTSVKAPPSQEKNAKQVSEKKETVTAQSGIKTLPSSADKKKKTNQGADTPEGATDNAY